ncbi:MAG: hypothetical protein B6242_00900 [Anaerolineaceae bacterium 4572_78]|nr:MAG: hypothetical protein B6242_00900 [Anaerolineaceae bacterium 4572_78]
MKKIMDTDMRISLDTNVWIFGLVEYNKYCRKILMNLSHFQVIVPIQVLKELNNNLSKEFLDYFYQLVIKPYVQLDYEKVPDVYITMFESKDLKKGDAIIGAFAEWRKVDMIVSDNRDFLRGLSEEYYFRVMAPQKFCESFNLCY